MVDNVTISSSYEADAVFSRDGTRVYLSDDTRIGVYDVAGGALLDTIELGVKLGAVATSPDGRYLIVAGAKVEAGGQAALYRIDLATDVVERFSVALGQRAAFFDVAIDAQGVVVASGAQHLYTLDPATGAFTQLPQTFSSTPRLQSSGDGETILVDSDAIPDVPIAIYRAGQGIVAEHHDYYDPYAGPTGGLRDGQVGAISADGSLVFDSYRLTIYDAQLQPVIHLADRFPYLSGSAAAFSPDGARFCLFGNGNVVVFDTATWDVTGMYAIGVDFVGLPDGSQFGNAFEVAPDGHTLKVMGTNSVTLVDLDTLAPSGGTTNDDQLSAAWYGVLFGFGGDDVLSVGMGRMYGGEGDDTYEMTLYRPSAIELADQGIDTVRSVVSYTLGDNLENLVLVGAEATEGHGNALANTITADATAARLHGYGGDDILNGGAGDDLLNGGRDVDFMSGGAGDDRYFVDGAADVVFEDTASGTDTVAARISYALGTELERLELKGHAAIDGLGNALANEIVGNDAANVLDGGGRADLLRGGEADDVLNGGVGRDVLSGGRGEDLLVGGRGIDVLRGGAGADVFRFNTGDLGLTPDNTDRITRFGQAEHDRIDLSYYDANGDGVGQGAFTFVGTASFSGVAGELRYEWVDRTTVVTGDVDGDGFADLMLAIDGKVALEANDFLLTGSAATGLVIPSPDGDLVLA